MTLEEARNLVSRSTQYINREIPVYNANNESVLYGFTRITPLMGIGENGDLRYSVSAELKNQNDTAYIPLHKIVRYFENTPIA